MPDTVSARGQNERSVKDSIFSEYADFYNIIYKDKDYVGEVEFISQVINKFKPGKKDEIKILDLACGTGRHAIELARNGYKVEGSDISAEMVNIAVAESKRQGLEINFYNESFQTADKIGKNYDVIISMFASLNYLRTYGEFSLSMKNIASLLKDDGIFVFDIWNGDAVVDGYSPSRVKRMADGDKEVIRISETSLDRPRQTALVKFSFLMIDNGRVCRDFSEDHLIRYYFVQEIQDFMEANRFKVIFSCPFMNILNDIKPVDWNITFVARKET